MKTGGTVVYLHPPRYHDWAAPQNLMGPLEPPPLFRSTVPQGYTRYISCFRLGVMSSVGWVRQKKHRFVEARRSKAPFVIRLSTECASFAEEVSRKFGTWRRRRYPPGEVFTFVYEHYEVFYHSCFSSIKKYYIHQIEDTQYNSKLSFNAKRAFLPSILLASPPYFLKCQPNISSNVYISHIKYSLVHETSRRGGKPRPPPSHLVMLMKIYTVI